MKRIILIFLSFIFVFAGASCAEKSEENDEKISVSEDENSSEILKNDKQTNGIIFENESQEIEISEENNSEKIDKKTEEEVMKISVNGYALNAALADTDAANELCEYIKDKPLTLSLSEYGSFEKVGKLPAEFTKSDEFISAQPGDIMLYQGNQITIFYGENSWDYTRLGKIENTSADELAEIFGSGDVEITISDTNFEE